MALLTKSLTLGVVELNVKDIHEMKKFYRDILLLEVLKERPEYVLLGNNKSPLLALHERRTLPYGKRTDTGLYHFAIVFSSRGDLARTVQHILTTSPESFSGTGDHLVSESFYFYDPENNGVELYFDRDPSTWQWENGRVKMATMYIDPDEYIKRYIVIEEGNTKTSLGHIHLKVGDIAKARKFYVEILGFAVTAELPKALFVSIGGYHHHIGINAWESYQALERDETLGLKRYELILSDSREIDVLQDRLREYSIPVAEEKQGIIIHDPWKNELYIHAHPQI